MRSRASPKYWSFQRSSYPDRQLPIQPNPNRLTAMKPFLTASRHRTPDSYSSKVSKCLLVCLPFIMLLLTSTIALKAPSPAKSELIVMDVYTRLRKRTFCTQIAIDQSSQIKTKPTAIKFISRGLSRCRSLISTSPASHSTKVRDSSRPSAPIMPPLSLSLPLKTVFSSIHPQAVVLFVCLRQTAVLPPIATSSNLHICTSPHLPHLQFSHLRLSTSPSLQIPIFPHLYLPRSPLSLPPIRSPSPHLPRPQPLKPTNPKPAHPPLPPSLAPISSQQQPHQQTRTSPGIHASKQASHDTRAQGLHTLEHTPLRKVQGRGTTRWLFSNVVWILGSGVSGRQSVEI